MVLVPLPYVEGSTNRSNQGTTTYIRTGYLENCLEKEEGRCGGEEGDHANSKFEGLG
jgi:hypothetical protein